MHQFQPFRRGTTRALAMLGVPAALLVVLAIVALGGPSTGRTAAQGSPAATPCPTTTAEENKELVQRYFAEAYNGRNLDVIDDLLADNFGRFNPARPHDNVPGNDDDVARVRDWLTDFPDLTITVDDIVAEGDRVAVRMTWAGTQQDNLANWNAPATNRRAEWSAQIFYRIECGQLRENWVAMDFLTQLRQLGVISDEELADAGTPTVATPVP